VNFGNDDGEEDKPEGDGRLDCDVLDDELLQSVDGELLVLRSGVDMSGDVFEEGSDWNFCVLSLGGILLDRHLGVFSC